MNDDPGPAARVHTRARAGARQETTALKTTVHEIGIYGTVVDCGRAWAAVTEVWPSVDAEGLPDLAELMDRTSADVFAILASECPAGIDPAQHCALVERGRRSDGADTLRFYTSASSREIVVTRAPDGSLPWSLVVRFGAPGSQKAAAWLLERLEVRGLLPFTEVAGYVSASYVLEDLRGIAAVAAHLEDERVALAMEMAS